MVHYYCNLLDTESDFLNQRTLNGYIITLYPIRKELTMSKIAVVTGASRGIGKAIAHLLASNGYDVHMTCYNHIEELTAYAKEWSGQYKVTCTASKVDMKDGSQVDAFFSSLKAIDLLVNNAGISIVGLLTDLSVEDWHLVMDTNISSMFYACRRAIPLMLQKHSGHIINISSIWGNAGASAEVAYSASKGAVNSFTRALGKELAPSNIQVNALALGVMDTDMNACFSQEEMEDLCNEIPADRLGMPEEAARMVLLLAQAPSYLTAQVITMDGGFL